MIKNYIFDLYGTLADIRTNEDKPYLWKKMAQLYSLQGAAYTPAELKSAYHFAVKRAIEERSKLFPSIPMEHVEPDILSAFASLYEEKNVLPSLNTVADTAVFFRTISLQHLRNYPSALATLKALREAGKGVFLLSNAQAAFTLPELHFLGLDLMFDGIILSSDVGAKKPNEAIFRWLFCKYNLSPRECIMVGNDLQADIQGAMAMGMGVRYIHTSQSSCRPEHIPQGCREINDLSELI